MTKVARYILETLPKGTILDFGCGRYANQVKLFRERGRTADGYDLWWEANEVTLPGLYSKLRPPPGKYDIIGLSNVLNVQTTEKELWDTLRESFSYLAPQGLVVANYPTTPRKLGWTAPRMKVYLQQQMGLKLVPSNGVWLLYRG